MGDVFVDTSAWIALLNVKDGLHAQTLRIKSTLHQQQARLVTTEFVLLEVADALVVPPIRAQAVAFIDGLRRSPGFQLVPASQVLFADGWLLYKKRLDKDWSLTDCISFVVMTQKKISQL